MNYLVGIMWVGGPLLVAESSISQELMGGVSLIAIVAGVAAAIFTAKTRAQRDSYRSQVDLANQAADAWKTERDAEVAKAERLALELRTEAQARIAAEARTDIRKIEQQIATNHKDALALFAGIKEVLTEIAANTRER